MPDVSDAGTESPDEGAPPPPGSASAGKTLPPRVTTTPFVRPQPTIPPSVPRAPVASSAPAPVASVGAAAAPPPVASMGAPAPSGRSPLAWAAIAIFAGGLAFALAFGLVTAVLLASR